jgi:hypothetical protein
MQDDGINGALLRNESMESQTHADLCGGGMISRGNTAFPRGQIHHLSVPSPPLPPALLRLSQLSPQIQCARVQRVLEKLHENSIVTALFGFVKLAAATIRRRAIDAVLSAHTRRYGASGSFFKPTFDCLLL